MLMDKIVEREVFASIKEHLKEKEITLIHGARQVGKTTLILSLMDYLKQDLHISESQILYYNLDLFYEYEKFVDQKGFVQYLVEKCANNTVYLFIDEAQYLEEAGRYLKGIYDLNLPIKMVVTGSSSLLLSHNTKESLMGRKQIFTVDTFSFREYLACEKKDILTLLSKRNISPVNLNEILEYLFQYLYFGGYPLVVLSPSKEQKERRLQEIYSSYIDKDVSQFLDIKNKISFARVLRMLASQIGSLINMTEIASTSQLSHVTVKHYLQSLEGTYIASLLRPFTSNIRSELVKMPKIYFSDCGFRNCTLKGFSVYLFERDKGVLLENFIYSELSRIWEDKIHFWRLKDGSEVDFIIQTENGNLIPIEVKASNITKPSIPIGLRSFLKTYSSRDAYIVNLSLEEDIIDGSSTFHFILPWQTNMISARGSL